jgi:hypothetical protein
MNTGDPVVATENSVGKLNHKILGGRERGMMCDIMSHLGLPYEIFSKIYIIF